MFHQELLEHYRWRALYFTRRWLMPWVRTLAPAPFAGFFVFSKSTSTYLLYRIAWVQSEEVIETGKLSVDRFLAE
eukprot:6490522-Amphidinium_carterae.1